MADALADVLMAPLELIFVRKLPIPHSPEAGFGAVALDGSTILNERALRHLHLSKTQIDRIVQEVQAELHRRSREYGGHDRTPDARGKLVYMVDDGLASGYTMMAAAEMIRRQEPQRITLCVPVSPMSSIRAAEPYFDEIYCLIAQANPPFAVASFYADFRDLTDAQVGAILKKRRLHTPERPNNQA